MGPTWVLSAPDGPHVGHMNIAIWDAIFHQNNSARNVYNFIFHYTSALWMVAGLRTSILDFYLPNRQKFSLVSRDVWIILCPTGIFVTRSTHLQIYCRDWLSYLSPFSKVKLLARCTSLWVFDSPRWCHGTETISTLLAICQRWSHVTKGQ